MGTKGYPKTYILVCEGENLGVFNSRKRAIEYARETLSDLPHVRIEEWFATESRINGILNFKNGQAVSV